jgi:K+-transporting ATPase ATPase C chain
MLAHVRANLWLLVLSVVLCSALYPLLLLGIGQFLFHEKAEGSLLQDREGKPVGSRLIAQPFTGDEYFQPRPSAASYNGSASGASNWSANNYLLRDRVAKALGPIVKYRTGLKKGQLVGPNVESWFQQDRFKGQPGIVAQWAQAHAGVAQAWVKADKLNAAFVASWQQSHPAEMAQWIKDNPDTPEPKPDDLAVPFFTNYSKNYPGTFPSAVEQKLPTGKMEKRLAPVREGTDIQGNFFDMWLEEHPQAELEAVPADLVMASGSGLDPHITLKSAWYQLDRVVGKWSKNTQRDAAQIRHEIENLLQQKAAAPLGGFAGVKLVNVLEVNLALREHFASAVTTANR